MRLSRIALFVVASLAGAASAQAQTQGLSFLDGGKPLSGVPVSRFLDGGKSPVSTTGTDGTVSIPIDALGFAEGETVAVWVRRCEDGRVTEVILTRENEDDPCPPGEGAQVGDDCGCEKLGTFVVGDGPRTFDVSRPTFAQRIGVGVGIDFYQWRNFEDVSGNQPGIMTHDASSTSIGFQGNLDYPCYRWPIAVGLDVGYTMLDTKSTFAQGTQTGDIRFLSVGPYVRIGPQRGRIMPYGLMSMDYTWNDGDFELDGLSESREHTTWRLGLGGGILYPFHPRIALRAEGKYSTTFEDNDADDHIRWKLGLMLRGGRYAQ